MAASMCTGITSSVLLETVLLRVREGMTTNRAFRTAMGMSFVSMLSMEAVANAVDWHLTDGIVSLGDPKFWGGCSIGNNSWLYCCIALQLLAIEAVWQVLSLKSKAKRTL